MLEEELSPGMTADGTEEQEEVLSREYLETAEEAAADGGRNEFPPASTVRIRRSGRRTRTQDEDADAPPRPLTRTQRRAKLIIRLGLFLLSLACVAAGTYKIPLLLKKGKIWPWSVLLPDREEVVEESSTVYPTRSGGTLTQRELDALLADATRVLPEAERSFEDGKAKYAEESRVEAIVCVTQAQRKLEGIAARLAANAGPQPLESFVKQAESLSGEIGLKIGQWRRDLGVKEAEDLQARLKETGLLEEAAPEGETPPEGEPAPETPASDASPVEAPTATPEAAGEEKKDAPPASSEDAPAPAAPEAGAPEAGAPDAAAPEAGAGDADAPPPAFEAPVVPAGPQTVP